MKFLFQFLKTLPSFQNLLAEWLAAENAKTEKVMADYKLKSLDDAATIERQDANIREWRAVSKRQTETIADQIATIKARDAEIERLQNETQQRLKAVVAMTDADVLLGQAREKVADFVDGELESRKEVLTDD